MRAPIKKLEAANAALKAKGREANGNAKAEGRRIAELRDQVSQFEADMAKATLPAPIAPPAAKVETARRGRSPGPSNVIDQSDVMPPGVAAQTREPLDEEVAAARDALKENLSEE